MSSATAPSPSTLPDESGHFGTFGGRFVPETLMAALEELTTEYQKAKADPEFQGELARLLSEFCGRETPLYFAERWTEQLGGARIYLKREDLLHTGAHKINNALGQIMLAKRLGKKRIIAETGAERIFVTHGYTSQFRAWLESQGYDAQIVETEFDGENLDVEDDASERKYPVANHLSDTEFGSFNHSLPLYLS